MVRLRHGWISLVLAGALTGAGCGAPGTESQVDPAARSTARLELTFTHQFAPAPEAAAGLLYEAQAYFARHRSSELASLPAMIGSGIGAEFDEIPLDTCRRTRREGDVQGSARDPEVMLLDVGQVEISTVTPEGTRWAALTAELYPELVPGVAGVVYYSDGQDAGVPSLEFWPGATYEIAGEGGDGIGTFRAQVRAPDGLPLLASADPVRRGEGYEVTWSALPSQARTDEHEAGVTGSPSGALLIETWEARCRVRDDGVFRIPAEFLPQKDTLSKVPLSLTRFARAPLKAEGLDVGVLSVEAREQISLDVLP